MKAPKVVMPSIHTYTVQWW